MRLSNGLLSIMVLLCALLCLTSCGTPEHKHSVLPGSEYCETCGEKIVVCEKCSMVNGADDEKCWFCKEPMRN